MSKNLQVNLAFTADTNAAMQNLQTLRNSLNEISSLPLSVGKGLNSDLQTASQSAQQLQKHLGAAMDVKTGNLNLNKLQSSLASSNQSLSQLTSGLLRAGTAGEKAFIATYSAIAQSNLQLKKSNTLLSQFALTLKNTAKWQLSSSLLHGLISGFSSAIGYAKDLDKSLNNIQIVTQQSADQMAEFAKQANKAAKELKTTTVAYTDAALIYYQQGLKGDDVAKRADTTVKLANVTGESAETVSQWMTAVWNNFDNGSKSLEYYADVMTALGAATASSSDEIAQGLEKFAAVADTVGLSYENATAALATITATTRQSADVVGTALKTLFARIQDLDLGKTLDDGTTLGSYSEALAKVGVNIKDASGQLKDMDDILDEMGAKWKTLDQDQQVALAKNVAGIRQYTQLIALMDNYDFYQQNQQVALGAEGTLEQQAEMYEQSWEAASKNVKASLESMYNVLIPTDFIVDFTNGLADVVSGFTQVLEAAGGLKTILLLISTVVLSKFQAQIASALDTGIVKTKTLIENTRTYAKENGGVAGVVKKAAVAAIGGPVQTETQKRTEMMNKPAEGMQAQYQEGLANALNAKTSSGQAMPLSEGFKVQVQSLQELAQYNTKILNLKDKMTQADFEQLQMQQQHLKSLGEQRAANIEKIEKLKMQLDILKEQQSVSFNRNDFEVLGSSGRALSYDDSMSLNQEEQSGLKLATRAAVKVMGNPDTDVDIETTSTGGLAEFANLETAKSAQTEILEIVSNTKQAELEIQQILDNRPSIQEATVEKETQFKTTVQETLQGLVNGNKLTEEQVGYIMENVTGLESMEELATKIGSRMKGISNGAQAAAKVLKVGKEAIADSVDNAVQMHQATNKNNQLLGQSSKLTKQLDDALEKVVNNGDSLGTKLVKGLQGFSQMAMGINMLKGAVDSLKNAFENGFDFGALLSGISSLGMALPMVISGFKTITTTLGFLNSYILINTAVSEANNAAKEAGIALNTSEAAAIRGAAIARALGITTELSEEAATKLGNISKTKAIALSVAMKAAKLLEALGITTTTGAMIAETVATGSAAAATWALIWPIGLLMIAIAALVAIIWVFVSAFQAIASNTPEARLAALEEAAKKSKEAMQEAATAVQELTDTLEGLKDKYKYIDSLNKSSSEWLMNMLQINEVITELVDKYPELSQYVSYENGYGELSEEGMEKALELARQALVLKTNVHTEDSIAVLEEKKSQINDEYEESKLVSGGGRRGHGKRKKTVKEYDLADSKSAAEYINTTFDIAITDLKNAEDIKKLQEERVKLGDEEQKALLEYLEDVEEANRLQAQINAMQDQQLVARAQALGSTRNAAELKTLLNIDSYDDLQQGAREKVENGGFNVKSWNNHINYSKGDAEWDMIEDFMKTQGDNVKYVAQRHGKMVLEIDGEEVSYTREEVEKTLTELYTGEDLENKLRDGLIETLSSSMKIKAEDLKSTSLETLNLVDDLKRGFDEALKGTSVEQESDKIFSALAASYERAYGGIQQGMEALGEETQYIDKTSTAFKNLVENIDPANMDKFVDSMRELNADGQLESMTSFFQTAAENMGLGEAEAQSMQNYALSLTDAAANSELLHDSLANNADAAAKVAVAITRMDQGIEALAEGFENWNDILLNSSDTSREYSDAMNGVKDALSNVLGVSKKFISNDFVAEHLEEIEAAATGSEDAIAALQKALLDDIICQIVGVADFSELDAEISNAHTKLQELANQDITVGAQLETGEFYNAAQDLINSANMTVDEAQAYFNALGYEPEFVTTEETVTRSIPQELTHTDYKITPGYVEIAGVQVPIPTIDRITSTRITGYEDLQETIQVPAISADGTPQIKSLTKTGSGGKLGNYSSSNKGGGSPGGKSGGGSSSKTSTKSKKEGDAYHAINRQIEKLTNVTDKLADAKDRAFGSDRIAAIGKEIDALGEEAKAQQKLVDIANKRIKQQQDEMTKGKNKKYGLQFDKETGEITNYDQVAANELNLYNQAVDEYNRKAALKDAGQLSDEEWEKAQSDFDDAETRYNDFETVVSTYEADLDIRDEAIEEQAKKVQDAMDKYLEAIEYGVEVNIEVNDRDIAVLERLLEQLDDDKFDGVERVSNMTQQMDKEFRNIEVYKTGIEQTLESAGASKEAIEQYMAGNTSAIEGLDLSDEQMQMLWDYTDGIMESEDAILELRDEIEGQVMATFEAWHEEIEKNGQAFEHATAMAESYKNIIDLVGKTRLGIDNSVLKDLEDTQLKAAKGAMANAKAQMDTTAAALEDAKKQLADAELRGDTHDIEKWKADIESLNETLMADQESFMSSWESALQTATDVFTAQMERAFEELEDNLAGSNFKSLDALSAHMDQQKTVADRYLDAGKQAYELSKLNRKLQQDMAKTDSTKAQRELLKLQEEIASYQENGTEMSERDLTALQKKYELKLAEIALEDAQNAKSQVRLQRDSEGNFGYVYTADQSNVADKQQAYEDKLEENRQLAISQQEELSDAILANRQAMVEALREIRQEDYEDAAAYQAALEETTRFYQEQEAYLIGETQKVIERSTDIYTNDYAAYDGWSTAKTDRMGTLYQTMNDTQTTAYGTLGQNTQGWVTSESELMTQMGINIVTGITGDGKTTGTSGLAAILGDADKGTGFFGASKSAATTWETAVEDIMKQAGIDISGVKTSANAALNKQTGASKDFTDFSTAVQEALYGKGGSKDKPGDGSVNGAMKSATSRIATLSSDAKAKFSEVSKSVTSWQTVYTGKINSSKTSTNNLNTAISKLSNKKIEVTQTGITSVKNLVTSLKKALDELKDKKITITNEIITKYTTEGTSHTDSGSGDKPSWDRIKAAYGRINAGAWGTGLTNRISKGAAEGYTEAEVRKAQELINYIYPVSSGGQGKTEAQAKSLMGYDTGGYTGEWGPDGRLAILHQKEIVLNAHDTENLLSIIAMVRDINSSIEANAKAMQYGLSAAYTAKSINSQSDTLQQEVHITAEFPNATNHSEIEEAFRNLNNLASQYANRKF